MSPKSPGRETRLAPTRASSAPKTGQLLGDGFSARTFEVRDKQGYPGFAKVYADVLLSEEFVGKEVERREKDGIVRTVRVGGLGTAAIKIYLFIALHTSGQGGTGDHPWQLSVEQMAGALVLKRSAVYRALSELKQAGLLEVSKRPGRRSIYDLCRPPSLRGPSRFPINGKNKIPNPTPNMSKMGRVSVENGTPNMSKMGPPYRQGTDKRTNNSSEDVICNSDNSHFTTTTGTESDARRTAAAMQREALASLGGALPGQLSLASSGGEPLVCGRPRQHFDDFHDGLLEQIKDPAFAKGSGLTHESIEEMRRNAWRELVARGDA